MAFTRARRFSFLFAATILAAAALVGLRYYLMLVGEDQVIRDALLKFGDTVAKSIEQGLQTNIVYQDMTADFWMRQRESISRKDFRDFVLSETFAPGLRTMGGMSLIPRVVGRDARAALEAGDTSNDDSERLRAECCKNEPSTGTSCETVAASGLFCNAGGGALGAGKARYQLTQFGPGGVLQPADGISANYLARTGGIEEYMVVHYIEPFGGNARVWGFNLLSSDARLAAWRSAVASGKKTITRRLSLVQGAGGQFGVLLWLPVFRSEAEPDRWQTAFDGTFGAPASRGLEPVGSVNGVYFVQSLFSTTLSSRFSSDQLAGLALLLFDDAEELQGAQQFLACHRAGAGPEDEEQFAQQGFSEFRDLGVADAEARVGGNASFVLLHKDVVVPNTDIRWRLVIVAEEDYGKKRRTNHPIQVLLLSIFVLLVSSADRVLGNPRFFISDKALAEGPSAEEDDTLDDSLDEDEEEAKADKFSQIVPIPV